MLTFGSEPPFAGPTTTETFATVTEMLARAQDLFSADAEINAYFLTAAEAEVLADEAATVAAELEALRTAEGLDATLPP